MSRHNLNHLFEPRSVAVIGASDRPQAIGTTVIRNLLKGGFSGPVWPVNIKHDTVAGHPACRTVAELPGVPELAVICTPASAVPGLIAELGALGTRAAVVISSGFEAAGPDGRTLLAATLAAAKPHLLRILGPNCLGLLAPRLGLNASFAHTDALPGSLAFIAQSGALMTALLDWAKHMQIGFSHFVSLGNSADVDFADLLDYHRDDPNTRAILLYIESISRAPKFMAAARAAALVKPVIVVKAGRVPEGAKAATSHTGALAGADDVYEEALRRAGTLRVRTTRELFDAAETLARLRPLNGERLAILSNGGGPMVMATDALIGSGGKLASLAPATIEKLNSVLPANWSHANPVDIVGDAPAQRYAAALEAVLVDSNVDAVLLIHAPTAIVPPLEIAATCLPLLKNPARPVLTCWMGGDAGREAESVCAAAGIPTYSTPEEAVGGFLQAVHYRRNQQLLSEMTGEMPRAEDSQREAARAVIEAARSAGRTLLMEHEAKQLLAAYGIPVVETRVARSVEELTAMAAGLAFPLVLKILSPDITHKSDVGGVALDIATPDELNKAARAMLQRCRERLPIANILGFTVQPMIKRGDGHELIAGVAVDPTFGPVILFGQGGIAVEVIDDKAVALPPLNLALARDLISRTRVQRLLAGYRNRPPIDREALELALVRLSQLAEDFPEIVELDMNPLLADDRGLIALDARVTVLGS